LPKSLAREPPEVSVWGLLLHTGMRFLEIEVSPAAEYDAPAKSASRSHVAAARRQESAMRATESHADSDFRAGRLLIRKRRANPRTIDSKLTTYTLLNPKHTTCLRRHNSQ